MQEHLKAVDADKIGKFGLLNPGQVYDYHAKVFGEFGLPQEHLVDNLFSDFALNLILQAVFGVLHATVIKNHVAILSAINSYGSIKNRKHYGIFIRVKRQNYI
ncbi:hypothetical protein ACQZ44_01100 [Agrobacterium vitis]